MATAEVLKTGGVETGEGIERSKDDAAAQGFRRLLQAAGLGAGFKLVEAGFGWLAGTVAATRVLGGGKLLLTGNISLSPALIGVGYIVGLNIAVLVFLGGVIGTVVGVPLNWFFNSQNVMVGAGIDPLTPWGDLTTAQWGTLAGQAWQDCRRIGVGAMMVGGLWSVISLLKPLTAGVKASLAAYRASKSGDRAGILRTEYDTPINYVAWVIVVGLIPVFAIFYSVLGDYPNRLLICSVMTVLMLVFGFIFSSVAGYMAGLVGSSNNPISGVTIATVVISALILLQLMGNEGVAATLGPIAVLYLAGLICSAAAIAGDNMQDLKCGHLVGATPWKQQVYQVVGVISAAFAIPFVLRVLDAGYGIGRVVNPDVTPLAAPQAALMGSIAGSIFGSGLDWTFIIIGFGLAVVLIVLDKIQESRGSSFRFPVLAVAVGVSRLSVLQRAQEAEAVVLELVDPVRGREDALFRLGQHDLELARVDVALECSELLQLAAYPRRALGAVAHLVERQAAEDRCLGPGRLALFRVRVRLLHHQPLAALRLVLLLRAEDRPHAA